MSSLIGTVDPADKWVMGLDVANITGGAIDASWTDQDYTAVEAQMTAWFTELSKAMHSGAHITETRYYRRAFVPIGTEDPVTHKPMIYAKAGPPERVFTHAVVGQLPELQAPQVALSITERTAYPKHWGRCYLAGVAANTLDTTGHFAQSIVDTVAQGTYNVYNGLQTAEFYPVVPVSQVGGVATRGLLGVDRVQVDNVPDVIRRRRPKTTTYRKQLPPLS